MINLKVMNDIVKVLNTQTGETGTIRRKWFDNPRINAGVLVEVKPDTKPYIPELYTPKTVEEFTDVHGDKLEPEASSDEVEPFTETRKNRKKEDSE